MDFTDNLQVLMAQTLQFLPKLIFALVTFAVTILFSSFAYRAIKRSLDGRKVNPQASQLFAQMVRWVILVGGTVLALQQINFNVTSFVAGLGILGFTAGFALQEVTQNFVAGMLLLIEQPFEVGDYIQVNQFEGHVQGIDLRATRITNLDGEDVLIPNSMVFSNAIVNYTYTEARRFRLHVGVTYDSDLELVEEIVMQAIRTVPMILEKPEPFAGFHQFGDSSINLSVYYWVDAREIFPREAFHEPVIAIKKAFDQAGISIPFPIRTVYMDSQEEPKN